MTRKEPFVDVSQYTRESARLSPDELLAKSKENRERLIGIKRELESAIASINSDMQLEIGRARSACQSDENFIKQSAAIRRRFEETRSPLARQLREVERELAEVSYEFKFGKQMPSKAKDEMEEIRDSLGRIERTLREVLLALRPRYERNEA